MNNVNTNIEEIFKTLFPMNSIDPEGFVINSRDLHKAMNVGRDYNTWIKGRISKYGFEKELDFTIIENLSSPNRGTAKSRSQIIIDYYVTLDVAKELCMVENNDTGKALRRYFIQAEKDLRSKSYLKANNTPYQKSIESGYMITKLVPTRVGVITVARVTAKGLDHLRNKLT